MTFITITMEAVLIYLSIVEIFIMLRTIYPIFGSEESLFYSFCFTTTEPLMYPVRYLIERSETLSSLPIDLSGILTFFVIMLVRIILLIMS